MALTALKETYLHQCLYIEETQTVGVMFWAGYICSKVNIVTTVIIHISLWRMTYAAGVMYRSNN